MTFRPYDPFSSEQATSRSTPQTRESASSQRTRGEDPVPAPSHSLGHVPEDFRQVNGWGADLDPANRPSFPRELPSDVMTVRGDVKHWQKPRTKIYVSNEHPGITPVFGESCPPHGLSGLLRDYAYQYGEATNRRWLTLMFADRVDVLESALLETFGAARATRADTGETESPRSDSGRRLALAGAAILAAVVVGAAVKSRR